MSVKSRENKALLWQLLSDHPFQKTAPKKFQNVFEYRINEVHNKRFQYKNDLMEMNKEVIRQFASEIANQSNARGRGMQQKQHINHNDNIPKNNTARELPAPQDVKDYSKIQMFEQKLKMQQDNFNSLINKNKPTDIDFSDKAQDVPIDVHIVDTTLQQRELDLKKIMNQYNTNDRSQKWLESQSTSKRLEKESTNAGTEKYRQTNTNSNLKSNTQTNTNTNLKSNTQTNTNSNLKSNTQTNTNTNLKPNTKYLMIDKQSQNIKIEPDFVFNPIPKQSKKVRFSINEKDDASVISSASSILDKLKKTDPANIRQTDVNQRQNTNINPHSNFAILKDIQNDIKSLVINQNLIMSMLSSLQKTKSHQTLNHITSYNMNVSEVETVVNEIVNKVIEESSY